MKLESLKEKMSKMSKEEILLFIASIIYPFNIKYNLKK